MSRTDPLLAWARRLAVVVVAIWIAPVIGTVATMGVIATSMVILVRYDELVERGRRDDLAWAVVDDPVTVGALTVLVAVLTIGMLG